MSDTRTPRRRRVVVTGASSGIGRATALRLAQCGWDVLVHCRCRVDAAREVADRIHALGREADVVAADLQGTDAAAQLVERCWERWGGLEAWVHIAGADILTGDAKRWSFERKLELLWQVDVRATILVCRHVLRKMKRRGRGAIVTIGWDQAETGMEGDSGQLFAAAKGAVMAFTKSLAVEAAPEVRVNCVAPGWIRTAWGRSAPRPWQERAEREALLRRWGEPEDVAATVAFLCSDDAAFITGQIVRVNGGAVRG